MVCLISSDPGFDDVHVAVNFPILRCPTVDFITFRTQDFYKNRSDEFWEQEGGSKFNIDIFDLFQNMYIEEKIQIFDSGTRCRVGFQHRRSTV